MKNRRPLSLFLRLALPMLAVEVLLVGGFSAGALLFLRSRLTKSFDSALLANAEALASLVQFDEASGKLNFEFSEGIMTRFSRGKRPDLFALYGPDGNLIEASDSMGNPPERAAPESKCSYQDFIHHHKIYRGLYLQTQADAESENDEDRSVPITVFFAASREKLNDDLEDALQLILAAAAAAAVFSLGAAFWLTRRGLLPLTFLTREVEEIDAARLGRRFTEETLPTELLPLGSSFNRLLARLESAFERERRFSADAAHELRTPVSILKSSIQAALLSPPSGAEDRETLKTLLEDVERLEQLCEALLLASSSAANRERAAALPIQDFFEEIESIADSFRERGRSAQARIEVSPRAERNGDSNSNLFVDETAIRRILSNLLDNALRYGGAGVGIQVSVTREEAGTLILAVEDDGPGIPPALQPRLFNRFARGEVSRSRASGGAGLGLAICRTLAESWGGTLEWRPRTPRGCKFLWTLAVESRPNESLR